MLKSTDEFWDTKAQEKAVVDDLDRRIGKIENATTMAQKILAIRGNAGWAEFVRTLEDSRDFLRTELELCDGSEAEFRILQGRCRALASILTLMNHTEKNVEALASHLQRLREERALYVTEDGRVKPRGIS